MTKDKIIHSAAQAMGRLGGFAKAGVAYQASALGTAAQVLGRLGGSVTSEAKAKSARENGKRGGRPSKASK
jgi:hypothetical protein